MSAIIDHVAHCLPDRILTNQELTETVDTSNEWIVQRTGIRQRHIADVAEDSASMAADVSKSLMEKSSYSAEDLSAIIVATSTPSRLMPSTAAYVQNQLGAGKAACFDLNAACSGFLVAMNVALDHVIRSQKPVMVIGSETMSRLVDWTDRATCVLFGDGAGGVLLSPSSQGTIFNRSMGNDARFYHSLKTNASVPEGCSSYITMEGRDVFKQATRRLSEVSLACLREAGLSQQDVNWLIPHQANKRIIESVCELMKFPLDKTLLTMGVHANTSAASIPLALSLGVEEGKIQRGQTLLMNSFGAGLNWATLLMRY